MVRLEYLFAAYTAIFVLIFLYVRLLSRRNDRLQKEIDEIKTRIKG